MPLAGGQGGSLVHTEIGSSVNPIATRGADYAHHITASPTRIWKPSGISAQYKDIRTVSSHVVAVFCFPELEGNTLNVVNVVHLG